jgi:hypothetical protein
MLPRVKMTITTSKSTVSEMQWTNRQPDELDYLRPHAFRFMIQSLPKVTYFCQAANIPNVSLGVAPQSTPFIDIPKPGEKLTYGELNIKFLIQEDMANYIELYNWMIALGFPNDRGQYRSRGTQQAFRNPEGATPFSSTGEPQLRSTDMTDFSDAALLVLDSNNNPKVKLNFIDCFPISLSGLDFDISSGNVQYFAGEAVFKYLTYTIEVLTT